MSYHHIPVLLQEVITILDPKPRQHFVDATLGGGGYTDVLLQAVGSSGKVLSIDADPDAIKNYEHKHGLPNSILAHGNFRDLDEIVERNEFTGIDGIVADIGLSSYQLDQAGRGISFLKDEPLDMRFDTSSNQPNAQFIVNHYSEQQLVAIFTKYGEDSHSKKIAQVIVKSRALKPILTAVELAEVIRLALPKPRQHKWQDSARRIFQALRIAVNHELESLEMFLPKALDLVKPGGKIVIVSFHSLEDRIVKRFFADAATGCICPKDFPICKCGNSPQVKLLTKKPVTASEEEEGLNSRSIPAKLRAIQKI